MAGFKLNPAFAHLSDDFADLDKVFALEGERLTRDPLSEVIRIQRDGTHYYVKRYWGAGKGLRRYIGRPRVKAEWKNLEHFARWGIPTATIVAKGLERKFGAFRRGAVVTLELPNTLDLAHIAKHTPERFKDAAWVNTISLQLAKATRTLHEHHFAHNDLKWRNLLVDEQNRLFFIDCPSGDFWWGPFLTRRIIKDLACLDKLGKEHLSQSQRLRFYLQYRNRQQLTARDKQRIRHIVKFFEGRE